MSRHAERETVIVCGVLEAGRRLEWRPTEAMTIYVGSDPSCEWRVIADGVAPFHWQLCWYGNRLWMAEVGPRRAAGPGRFHWTMAPIGTVLRLGSAVIVLETAALAPGRRAFDAEHNHARRTGPSDPTLLMHTAPTRHSSRSVDPDTTLLVDADELRNLPLFGPPQSTGPRERPRAASRPPAAWGGTQSLEEMFIVPADQAAPPPKRPGPLARVVAVVPARILIALLVTGGTAALMLLPESLHANRDEAAPAATLPPRRPPPEAEIELRAVEPDPARSIAELAASRDLAAGRLEEALRGYRSLLEAKPDDPVFRDFVAVIEHRIKAKARCRQGDCADDAQEEEAK